MREIQQLKRPTGHGMEESLVNLTLLDAGFIQLFECPLLPVPILILLLGLSVP